MKAIRRMLVLGGVALPVGLYGAGCSSTTTSKGFNGTDSGSDSSSGSSGSSGGSESSSGGSSGGSGSSSGGSSGSSGSSGGGTMGACQTPCAATYCAATPTVAAPTSACGVCLSDSLSEDAGGVCLLPVATACGGDEIPKCLGWLSCVNGCPDNSDPATNAYDGGTETDQECSAFASNQDCVNCCALSNAAAYETYINAVGACECK